jgi:hypothetical protein
MYVAACTSSWDVIAPSDFSSVDFYVQIKTNHQPVTGPATGRPELAGVVSFFPRATALALAQGPPLFRPFIIDVHVSGMAPLADFLLAYAPLPSLPVQYTKWIPGETPLSTNTVVVSSLVTYLAVIFGIREVMRDRAPVKANAAFMVHNTFLYTGSGLLLALMLEEIIPLWWKGGAFYALCHSEAWTRVRTPRMPARAFTHMLWVASGVLLHDQLLLQIRGAHRHRLPRT